MAKPYSVQAMKGIALGIASLLILPFAAIGQTDNSEESDLDRTFMPAIQMGYVGHGTEELSGGLMTQTSIEYRDISFFILRLNYDTFNSNMDLEYPINSEVSFTGRTSFSDLIIGVGYRHELGKHNITGYIQPGLRFYGYPIFTTDSTQINLDYDSRQVGIIRYSVGYEYEIVPKMFLIVEGLVSHSLKARDFWADNPWSYGITFGISAPLF